MDIGLSTTQRPDERYAGIVWTATVGILLGVAGVLLFLTLVELWPAVDRPAKDAGGGVSTTLFLFFEDEFTVKTGLIVLAVVAGGLGAFVHTATSYATYVGNRSLKTSWLWWYLLRLPIGAALAVILYFAFRAGLLTTQAGETEVNPYGVAAISALTGLFSKQATDKLKEVFDTLFRAAPGQGDALREDKPEGSGPVITELAPSPISVGQGQPLTVKGHGFVRGSTVCVGGTARSTAFVSAGELKVTLTPADTEQATSLSITVKGPEPEERTSPPVTLKVEEP